VGLVWDLREPPASIVRGESPVGRKVVEKVAQDLASSISVEAIVARVKESWAESNTLEELAERARRAREQVEEGLAELSLAYLPTIPELRERAEEMFQESPSLDEIVNRAHELLQRAVVTRVCDLALAGA
jgi:stearoyl-CoA desaturase (delta-9 desaturase)